MNVYEMDIDFIAARNIEEAIEEFRANFSTEPDEVRKLNPLERQKIVITQLDEDDAPAGKTTLEALFLEETGGKECDAFLLCSQDE